jgi:hypothetical protein
LPDWPNADWIVEAGIGETRAVLIEGDEIIETRIAVDGAIEPGTVVEAQLVARFPDRGWGVIAFEGSEALLTPLPAGVTQGARLFAEITREATPEPGKPKRARARPAEGPARPAPGLAALATPQLPGTPGPDPLESTGWSALLDEAATGLVAFPGGWLSISPTPAMTVIDIDGTLPGNALAVAGTRAAAAAIRRLGIGGSIGIDLPNADKAARQEAAAAIDAILPQPFERTAINGFGFVQIVRRRERRSLIELHAEDPATFHARALLRTAERSGGTGERTLAAAPAVIAALEAHPAWLDELAMRLGVPVTLRADPGLAISAGHVAARHP